MKEDKINVFMAKNSGCFPVKDLQEIRVRLNNVSEERMDMIMAVDFKNPILYFIINLFLPGLERILLGQVGWGLLKLLTGGGFGIWWIYDMFVIMKKVRELNYQTIFELTM